MKTFLMHKDLDFNQYQKLVWNEQALIQDIELNTLFNAMAGDDKFLFDVAKAGVLSGLFNDIETVLYRQDVLKDCIKNPSIIRDLYKIAVQAIEKEKKDYWGIFNRNPSLILSRSLRVMEMFAAMLKELRSVADKHSGKFESEGFKRFFSMLFKELSDGYFISIQNHLKELEFHQGILVSAVLGKGNKGNNYVLHKVPVNRKNWILQLIDDYIYRMRQEGRMHWLTRLFKEEPDVHTFYISSRDDNGIRALSQLKDEGINSVANTLAQSNDYVLGFFRMLKTEIGFYIGCLNLYEKLSSLEEPVTFPIPVTADKRFFSSGGLYDACLALTGNRKVVGNNIFADNKNLVIITGANQGGKSTFLRSVGLSQLMMQCGMFVPAVTYTSSICDSLITHFRREEDKAMKSGKLDEELDRMNTIIENLTPDTIILFNESFSATNEREGSEIARQIVTGLVEKNVRVFFVTHLYEFANGFFQKKLKNTLFLRAERQADASRTFRLFEGEPLQTSYGEDLYKSIFSNS